MAATMRQRDEAMESATTATATTATALTAAASAACEAEAALAELTRGGTDISTGLAPADRKNGSPAGDAAVLASAVLASAVLAPADLAADDANACSGSRRARGRGFDRKGTGNGMLNAGGFTSRWAVAWRHLKVRFLSKLPGTRFKSRLVRKWLGVEMGRDVGIGYGVILDPFDPSMISFGDNVIVGTETRIFVHVFMLNRQRVRPVRIGSNVMIGGFCVIAPGVTIGDGASIAPGTFITRDVPAGAIVTGNTMTIRRRGRAVAPAAAES